MQDRHEALLRMLAGPPGHRAVTSSRSVPSRLVFGVPRFIKQARDQHEWCGGERTDAIAWPSRVGNRGRPVPVLPRLAPRGSRSTDKEATAGKRRGQESRVASRAHQRSRRDRGWSSDNAASDRDRRHPQHSLVGCKCLWRDCTYGSASPCTVTMPKAPGTVRTGGATESRRGQRRYRAERVEVPYCRGQRVGEKGQVNRRRRRRWKGSGLIGPVHGAGDAA